jgi:hypothetical protein
MPENPKQFGRLSVARQLGLLVVLVLVATEGGTQSALQRSVSPPAAVPQTGGIAPSWGSATAGSTEPNASAGGTPVVPRGFSRGTLAAAAPPAPRDCTQLIQRPNPSYVATNMTHWNTDGTEDNGQILNQVGAAVRELQGNLNDLQVRIAQLRCADQNMEDKLDYLIRRLQ